MRLACAGVFGGEHLIAHLHLITREGKCVFDSCQDNNHSALPPSLIPFFQEPSLLKRPLILSHPLLGSLVRPFTARLFSSLMHNLRVLQCLLFFSITACARTTPRSEANEPPNCGGSGPPGGLAHSWESEVAKFEWLQIFMGKVTRPQKMRVQLRGGGVFLLLPI